MNKEFIHSSALAITTDLDHWFKVLKQLLFIGNLGVKCAPDLAKKRIKYEEHKCLMHFHHTTCLTGKLQSKEIMNFSSLFHTRYDNNSASEGIFHLTRNLYLSKESL